MKGDEKKAEKNDREKEGRGTNYREWNQILSDLPFSNLHSPLILYLFGLALTLTGLGLARNYQM
jgi:hypothetical protein